MTPETFVVQIRKAIIERNVAVYKDILETASLSSVNDPYWKRVLTLYGSLGEQEKNVLLDIMRQATVDTISSVFAILDGGSSLEGTREDFVLGTTVTAQQINGNLQDLFLEAEEKEAPHTA